MSNEPSSFRLAGTMAFSGLLSGLILVVAYFGTLPKIQHNRAEALKQAIYRVLPGTKTIDAFALEGGTLVPFAGQPGAPSSDPLVYRGSDEAGKPLGFAIPAEGAGFQDTIKLLYGYDPARRAVVGLEMLGEPRDPGPG